MNTTFIYTLENPQTNNVFYVGKTNTPAIRLKKHLCGEGSNQKSNYIVELNRNGIKAEMNIIDEVEKSNWQFWEKHYISLYKSWGFELMNSTNGGDGADSGTKHTEEAKFKISKANKGCIPHNKGCSSPMKGIKLSDEHRKKMSISHTGKKLSEEHKRKLSESHIGIESCLKGRKLSLEHKKRLSESHKGQIPPSRKGCKMSEESKKKISEALKKTYQLKTQLQWHKI